MICHAQLYTNYYFSPNSFSVKGVIFVFPFPLASTTDEVEHPWGPSSNDDFLGILSSNFRPHNLRNALQGVNSMVKLVRTNCYCRYRGF